ncbi:hypothetical protein TNCT_62641 [Trichonephila clavata]|uniref:Uncharacterized protein n=1 Tax=Trichonephila clavata TaxID=2740835 RepID=A0A8X6L7I4_TRICU|nr:hypothetical protein TNCT_62641 [Trichonephila clavata]
MKLKDGPKEAKSGGGGKLHNLYKVVQEKRRYSGDIVTKKVEVPVPVNLATQWQPTNDKSCPEGPVPSPPHSATTDNDKPYLRETERRTNDTRKDKFLPNKGKQGESETSKKPTKEKLQPKMDSLQRRSGYLQWINLKDVPAKGPQA